MQQVERSFDAVVFKGDLQGRDPEGRGAVGSLAVRTSALQPGLLEQQLEAAREQMAELKKVCEIQTEEGDMHGIMHGAETIYT